MNFVIQHNGPYKEIIIPNYDHFSRSWPYLQWRNFTQQIICILGANSKTNFIHGALNQLKEDHND